MSRSYCNQFENRKLRRRSSINWKEVGRTTRQSLQVYGRIPPQAAEPGAYSDTVVVTVTY